MFVRSDKKSWAPGVLPLMLVPFLTIVYYPIGRHIAIALKEPARADTIRLVLYAIAFLAMSFWTVAFARGLPKGKSKLAYIFSSIIFTAILIIIFILKFRIY